VRTVIFTAVTTSVASRAETIELNVEILRSENKKEHTEIIEQLVTSNEINGEQIIEVENRVSQPEADSAVAKSH
jgi:hypothetical protein